MFFFVFQIFVFCNYKALKGNIRGYFKDILKAILGLFFLFWSISWLPFVERLRRQGP